MTTYGHGQRFIFSSKPDVGSERCSETCSYDAIAMTVNYILTPNVMEDPDIAACSDDVMATTVHTHPDCEVPSIELATAAKPVVMTLWLPRYVLTPSVT